MSGPVLKAVGEAVEALEALKDAEAHPPDLLHHFRPRWTCYPKPGHEEAHDLFRGMLILAQEVDPERGKPRPFSAPPPGWDDKRDAERLGDWLRTRLQPVLKVLSEDKVAADVLAEVLPSKLRMYESAPEFHMSKGVRDKWQQIVEKRQRVLDALPPGEAVNFGALPLRVGRALAKAEERRRTAKVEWEGAFVGLPAITVVTSRIEKKVWYGDPVPWFCRGCPAVWPWAIWRFWPDLMGSPPIPGVPVWPGADECRSQSGTRFLFALRVAVGERLELFPGEAANGFMWALEELREKLEALEGRESDSPLAGADRPDTERKAMPKDSKRKAAVLRKVAEALRAWGELKGPYDSPEAREAAKTALDLATRHLDIIIGASIPWGCSPSVGHALEQLQEIAARRRCISFDKWWSRVGALTQRHLPDNVGLPDELDCWAAELEKAEDVSESGAKAALPEGEQAAPNEPAPPAGNWSRLMPLTDLADRLLKDPKKVRKLRSVYKNSLMKRADKSWMICLDGLPENLRKEVERA
jgi:hypothetical protein